MRLLNSLLAIAALFVCTAGVQAQILPRPIGKWEATAGFRALMRPKSTQTNTAIFTDTATGATLLDSDTLTELNLGAGPDISFSSTREDGLDYELRFLFNTFDRETLTQAADISSPFFVPTTGLSVQRVEGRYSSDMFSVELNQKRILGSYVRVLHGIRFLNIEENLNFDSTGSVLGVPLTSSSATRARNPMLGYQIGAESRVAVVPGLDVAGYFKAGGYNNWSDQRTVQFNNLAPGSVVTRGSESTVAFASDFGMRFQFHIVDDFMSAYFGYDGMYVNNFAAAPTNVSVSSAIDNNDSFWLHGVTFGITIVR